MDFFAPTTVDEVVRLLDRYRDRARVLAGGTDLVLALKSRKEQPEALVSLGHTAGLGDISQGDGMLMIGASVTPGQLLTSPLVAELAPVLAQAAAEFGAPAVRDMATVGGNLITASPAADLAVALLAVGAEAEVVASAGTRRVPVAELFAGPRRSAVRPNELLTGVRIPISPSPAAGRFVKLAGRRALAISVVSVAVCLDVTDGVCRAARIALGAVAPTPVRTPGAEAVLAGQVVTPDLVAAAADRAGEQCSPIDDIRGTGAHRRRMTRVLVGRALSAAIAAA